MSPAKAVITQGDASIHLEGTPEFVEGQMSRPEVLDRVMRMIACDKASPPSDKAALEHTWQWFALHAGQRMQGINFFLVAVAFLIAAFVTAVHNHDRSITIVIGIFGAFMAGCFSLLELRIRELIKAGEAAMKPLQARLAGTCAISELEILQRIENPQIYLSKYSIVIRLLQGGAGFIFILAAIYAYLVVA